MAKKTDSKLVSLLLVLLVAVALFAIVLQWGNLQEQQASVAREQQELELAETRLASLRQLAQRQVLIEEDLDLLLQLVPEGPQENELIVDLQAGADLSQMEFIQIRFGGRNQHEGFVEMPLDTNFVGTYHELLFFLDYLKVYERAVRIDALQVDATQDSNDMTVNIRASVFYAVEAAETAEAGE